MSTLTVQLPDSLKEQVERLALKDGSSVGQFLALAAAEKVSAMETGNYLAQRTARADRAAFLKVMAKVPDTEPEPWDRLPWRQTLPPGNSGGSTTRNAPRRSERRLRFRDDCIYYHAP